MAEILHFARGRLTRCVARKAALAAKDVQKAMNEEGRRAAREAAKAAAEAVAKSAEADLATLGTAMGALSKTMQWRLHNSARATAAGVQDVVSRDNLKMPANVQRAYLEVVAQAVARVNSGMAGYEQATREAVLKLARLPRLGAEKNPQKKLCL